MADATTAPAAFHDSTATTTEPPRAPSKLLSRVRSGAAVLFVLALAFGLLFVIATRWDDWLASRTLQTTDDAQVHADVTPLSTKSSGIVAVVAVGDYQRVKAGDLVVQLKDDDFRAQVELARASVLAAEAALETLKSQRTLQSSRIAAARANLEATKPDVERTRLELVREQTLEHAQVSTKQRLEIATAEYGRLSATLISRRAELDAQAKQLAVLDTQELELAAELEAKRAALKVAEVNLDYTRIVAPADGVVGERKVRPGQLVSAGTQVLSLVGTTAWVIANYKEMQLAHVKVGDPATIRVDGVPGVEWTAHVETIAPASGAVFSLLPPDNATGNFTKIAQRIPVKLVLDAHQPTPRLRPGMSATTSIRIAP